MPQGPDISLLCSFSVRGFPHFYKVPLGLKSTKTNQNFLYLADQLSGGSFAVLVVTAVHETRAAALAAGFVLLETAPRWAQC